MPSEREVLDTEGASPEAPLVDAEAEKQRVLNLFTCARSRMTAALNWAFWPPKEEDTERMRARPVHSDEL